jgi:AcrR family transcriptional regulator
MKKRKYTLKQRALQQEETRERIVDAAMALHEELGPARTTIQALADRAGVQRLTVYRHFADEREILQACSAKWIGLNPPPDPALLPEGEPIERVHAMLAALYDYYRETEQMWTSLYKDLGRVPALTEAMAGFEAYLDSVRDALLRAFPAAKTRRLRATLGHALAFSTFVSLSDQGLGRKAMPDLVCDWVRASTR